MKKTKAILLSNPIAWIMKYLTPIIILFITSGIYTNGKNIQISLIIALFGIVYWLFFFLPLKEVKFEDDFLIISNDIRKDKIHINEIDNLTTGGWSMYLTRIYFKSQTKFGKKIVFATQIDLFGGGINEKAKSILLQIKENIEIQKNQTSDIK
ncbi:MAG: hypothetical protein NTZ33_11150 [Bacteroidetes bacterium]|nr:hypothetical protein [Bacteroidota bacterium]